MGIEDKNSGGGELGRERLGVVVEVEIVFADFVEDLVTSVNCKISFDFFLDLYFKANLI